MNGPVVLDTNLLMLLVVGTASRDYITRHKRLAADFTEFEFELLVEMIGTFSELILIPHIVAETSSLVRHISNPMRMDVQDIFKNLITSTPEYPVGSFFGAQRDEFLELGITDSVILHFLSLNDIDPTLMSIDSDLLNRANALGYNVVDCRSIFWSDRP
jgi:hypothetical protein